jgi:hypothetical protein
MISIPVSVGELLDKLSILHIKQINIKDSEKLEQVRTEYLLLYDISQTYLVNKDFFDLYDALITINSKLWNIEDEIRIFEKKQLFNEEFIKLARAVYYTNDERFEIKNKINQMTNSELKEQKSYEDYKTQTLNTEKIYMYESPDGGNTVYQREVGQPHETRELVKK